MRALVFSIVVVLGLGAVFQVAAQTEESQIDDAAFEDLWTALRMNEFSVLLAKEGRAEARKLEKSLFETRAGPSWEAAIADIYSQDTIRANLKRETRRQLGDGDFAMSTEFFREGVGARAIAFEMIARRALLDPNREEFTRQVLEDYRNSDNPRLELVERYVVANGVVDSNVSGALNSNYIFLKTLADADQGPYAQDPGAILGAVWAQEPTVREDTTDWALSYYIFSFERMEDQDIEDLIAFSELAEAERLNAGMYRAFDEFFADQSRKLAEVVAWFLNGQKL